MKPRRVIGGVTVKEILRLPALKDAKVLSGQNGLERIVRYVDIMEIPEIKPWLREGELLLTTAYVIRDEPALLPKLVEDLAQAGAAALAFKPERFIHQVPQEMIEMSNLYNLPVISIPVGIPSIDITHSVMELVLHRQMVLLRRADEIHTKLTTMVLENRGIQVVADSVSELLNCPIVLTDSLGEVIVTSPRGADKVDGNRFQYDIVVGKQLAGKLIVKKNFLDDLDQVCVGQARVVFSLELMRKKTAEETESRLRGTFVDELLSEVPPVKHEVQARGRQLELDPEMLWEIAIIESSELDMEKSAVMDLPAFLKREGQMLKLQPHVEMRGKRILLFLPSQERSDFKWDSVLKKWLYGSSFVKTKTCIGIGKKHPLWNVNQSYVEAGTALRIGSRIYFNQPIVLYENVEIYQILSKAVIDKDLWDLFERKLGKLIRYDQETGSEFLKTLFVYLESGCNTQETATKLFIHRNSVKYRLDRIQEVGELDLGSPMQSFIYHLCLAWYFLKGS